MIKYCIFKYRFKSKKTLKDKYLKTNYISRMYLICGEGYKLTPYHLMNCLVNQIRCEIPLNI